MAYDIFISYRRKGAGSGVAGELHSRLENAGYKVFLDVDEIRNGPFPSQIENAIIECRDFLLVLSKGALDRCITDKEDWVLKEIALAKTFRKNIICISLEDYEHPKIENLPNELRSLFNHQIYSWSHEFRNASFDKIKKDLISENHNADPNLFFTHKTLTLKIKANVDCYLLKDDEQIAEVQANKFIKIKLIKGKHYFTFIHKYNSEDIIEQIYEVKEVEIEDVLLVNLHITNEITNKQKTESELINNTNGIKLIHCGDSKLLIVKIIKELTGLGLKEAKDLADGVPCIILDNIPRNNAKSIIAQLEDAGAKAEIVKLKQTQHHVSSKNGKVEECNDVVLINSGAAKLQVVKIIKDLTGLGLKESKDIVDSTPSYIKKYVSVNEAESLKAILESTGAEVLIQKSQLN